MRHGARALLVWRKAFYWDNPDGIVEAFRREFYDTEIFFDPFAGGKFGQFLFRAHQHAAEPFTPEAAHRLIEEAQLFIEACHSCSLRLSTQAPVTA